MKRSTSAEKFRGHEPAAPERITLSLYVVSSAPSSARAVSNVRKLCESYLPGRYDLTVVDLSAEPAKAAQAQVIAAPTLVKEQPPPTKRFIGDMSDIDRILSGLDVSPRTCTNEN